jgi:hypothetical protein
MATAATSIFPEIYNIINKNPNRNNALTTSVRGGSHTPTQSLSEGEPWEIFSLKPIQPPGALSLILWNTNSLYSLASVPLRKQLLVDTLLELHGRVDNELIGRRWPRKKIQDLLAGQVSANDSASSTPVMLEEVLCELFRIQKVQVNRKTKTISFFPRDVRCWVSDRPVIFADDDNCWYFDAEQNKSVLGWVSEKEEQSWTIQWPTADGKLEELKAALTKKNLVAHTTFTSDTQKLRKDDYARILGRAESIEILGQLNLRTQ